MNTRYFVIDGTRKAIQYANADAAREHAKSIGAIVKEMPFEPQYSKKVGVRGGQARVREFGTRHSDCSRQQADADGVKWFEVR